MPMNFIYDFVLLFCFPKNNISDHWLVCKQLYCDLNFLHDNYLRLTVPTASLAWIRIKNVVSISFQWILAFALPMHVFCHLRIRTDGNIYLSRLLDIFVFRLLLAYAGIFYKFSTSISQRSFTGSSKRTWNIKSASCYFTRC